MARAAAAAKEADDAALVSRIAANPEGGAAKAVQGRAATPEKGAGESMRRRRREGRAQSTLFGGDKQ